MKNFYIIISVIFCTCLICSCKKPILTKVRPNGLYSGTLYVANATVEDWCHFPDHAELVDDRICGPGKACLIK